MTFLKKLGQTVLKVVGLATGFLPLFSQTFGSGSVVAQVTDDLTKVASAVQTVEVVIGAVSDPAAQTGSQKIKAVIPLIAQIVQQSEIMSDKKISNETLFTQGCQELGQGMADILNSLGA